MHVWRTRSLHPAGAARTRGWSLEEADARLLDGLERDFAAVRERAGVWLACKPGCAECCHGPFPVTRLDARRLHHGLSALASRDPARARRVVERARRAVRRLRNEYPGDATSGRLTHDEEILDRFFERHGGLACPVLDPATGRCELYEWRPVSCRTYGPPVRFGDERAPACRLCFRGAPRALVESCRVAPDREGLEEAILARMGAGPGEDWETLIPWALASRSSAVG